MKRENSFVSFTSMSRKLSTLLAAAGLNEKEILLYKLLRKYEQLTIPELVYRSKLPNIAVYRTLQDLEERGLITSLPINKKQKVYAPNPLSSLCSYVASEQRRLRKLELALQDFDASIKILDDADEGVQVYEGKDAFREQFMQLPSLCTDEYLHIGSVDGLWEGTGYTYESPEIRSFVHNRMRKNIFAREFTLHSEEAEKIQQNDSREKRTTVLKQSLPVMDNMLVITDEQVSHFVCDPEDLRVIVMTDPSLVQMHRGHFEMMWS